MNPLCVASALRWAQRALGTDRLESQVLLGHVLGRERSWLFAHGETTLAPHQMAHYQRLLERRRAGEPIAYLTGVREFFGHRLRVGPSVLIPRPETELLVERALAHLRHRSGLRQVLELGTGSGAIAIALAHSLESAQGPANPHRAASYAILASDCSATALTVARANAHQLARASLARQALRFCESDWYEGLNPGDQPFDCILANPPYIAENDHHLQIGDLRVEPAPALASGDGLAALRTIIAGARARLKPGGALMLEHGHDQGAAVRALLLAAGLQQTRTWPDLAGHDRVSTGVR